MVMTLLRRERWSDAVAGMVTLRPCPGIPEAQILWCPEPARETLNPARRARLRSSVVVLGIEPVGVPPEVRRVSWVLVVLVRWLAWVGVFLVVGFGSADGCLFYCRCSSCVG